MSKSFSTKDAQAIAKWHLDIMSKLSSAANDKHVPELDAVKHAYATTVSKGCFERCFEEEVVGGSSATNQTAELERLLVALFCRTEALRRSSQCANALATNKPEIERLLNDLEPALRGLGWLIATGRKKVNAEAAYGRLADMKDGAYGATTRALLDEPAAPSAAAARECFAEDPDAFRTTLVECCNIQPSPTRAKEVDDVIARFQEISDRSGEIKNASRQAKSQAEDAIQSMLTNRASELLKDVPIEDLRRYRKGIRLSGLRDAGCTTIGDLEGKDLTRLVGGYGASWGTANDVIHAFQEIKASAMSSSKIKISVDNKTPASTALVTSLYKLMRTDAITSGFTTLPKESLALAKSAIQTLERDGHPTIWVFRPARERAEVANAYRSLAAVIDSDYGVDVENRHEELDKLSERGVSMKAWSSFANNPTEYFNLIERLAPGVLGSDEDFLQGLPPELVEEIKDEPLPSAGLKCTLRRYQEWGVKYILHQGKVLLGDEMGLGKTIEAIAAMVALQNAGAKRFMVVCPAGVLPNWCREIGKHSDLKAVKVHGPDRHWELSAWIDKGGVAVTTYETVGFVRMAAGDTIDMLVVDEAHYVKNPGTKRSQNVANLIKTSKRVLFMTGTALENRVDEMITLISYLRPDIAKKAQKHSSFATATAFREAIAPVYYRRKRDDVLTELPELIEYDSWCDMTEAEISAYENAALAGGQHAMRRVSWNVGDPKQSTKLKRLREIINEAKDDGRRVIVFSYYLDTISMVHEALGDSSLLPITGSVSPRLRQDIIDQFNSSPAGSVLVSQIMAGGTGLNIQAASVVVICEPQYKPSTESQAISRAYRMGQARNVIVHRLLAADTIDERITEILEAKQNAFAVFADKSVAAEESLGIDEKEVGQLIAEEIERIKAKHGIIGDEIPKELQVAAKQLSSSHEEAAKAKKGVSADSSPKARPGRQPSPLFSGKPQEQAVAPSKVTTGKVRTSRRKKTFTFSVAGLNKQRTGDLWLSASAWNVTASREKNNRYDKNAVALLIDGRKAGYIPRSVVPPIAAMIDEGYEVDVVSVDAEEVPEKRRRKDEWGDYYYEEDWEKTFCVAKVKITLHEPRREKKAKVPAPSKKETIASASLSEDEAGRLRGHLPESLSDRQKEAYLLLAQGMSRGDAGFAMGIRESTVQDYAKSIYKILGIHSKRELIEHARKLLKKVDGKKK